MKIEKKFATSIPNNILIERIISHMQERNFRKLKSESLAFSRGTSAGSFSSFTPGQWYCKVTIDLRQIRNIKITFDINTKWQIVLPWEKSFWKLEMDSLIDIIAGSETNLKKLNRVERKAFQLNMAVLPLTILIISALGALVVIGPILIIAPILRHFYHISESSSLEIGLVAWWSIMLPGLIFMYIKYTKHIKRKAE